MFLALATGAVERAGQASNRFDTLELVGGCCILAGCALRLFAIQALGGRFRTETTVPSDYRLQTGGIYAVVRHPSEVGLILLLGGTAALLSSPLAAVLAGLQLPLIAWRVEIEHRSFKRALGDTFVSYRRRVAGFVPYLF